MSDRDDAIARVRGLLNATRPGALPRWEDLTTLLAAYDEAVEMQAELEADLDDRNTDVAHLEARVEALLRRYVDQPRAIERRLAIAQEVLEGITQHCMGWVSVIANSALRRMKEIDRDE